MPTYIHLCTTSEVSKFFSMNKLKLVVVGNGMAGMRTVEELLKIAPELYDITVFGDEPHPNYNRIMLSPVLANEQTIDDIILHTLDWYAENNITLYTGERVTHINRKEKFVETTNGLTASYDRLLIATGSKPFLLPIPGAELAGVIGYRDIEDTNQMIAAAKQYKHAIVIGGGLLGLEAANGLKVRGMNVTVVHRNAWLLERQLDQQAANMLQQSLEKKGIQFELEANTQKMIGDTDGRVTGIQLDSGKTLKADLVVMAVGIRPNFHLGESAGLTCERGIVVDDHLQTSDSDIYAVGECVNHRGVNYGLVAPLYEMANVCASHLAQLGDISYQGSVTSTKLKVTGIDLFSAGNFMGTDASEEILLHDTISDVYKKIVIEDDKIIGSCLYGDTADGAWYFQLLKEHTNIQGIRNHLMFGKTSIEQAA